MISGSLAAFTISVIPSAKTAANNTFSVAPTLGDGNSILVPRSFETLQVRTFSSSFKTTPIFLSEFIWISIGLFPMVHPPGYEITACLFLLSSAPKKRMDPRVFFAVSPVTGIGFVFVASIIKVLLSHFT